MDFKREESKKGRVVCYFIEPVIFLHLYKILELKVLKIFLAFNL